MNGNIKLWQIAATLLGFFVLTVGSMWGMIEKHAAAPHPGAVSRQEMELIREMIGSHQRSLELQISRLERTISDLRSEVKARDR